jgi:hypothetical protein
MVARLQAGKMRELRYLAMAREIAFVLSFQIRTAAHRAFFLIRPADKGAGV